MKNFKPFACVFLLLSIFLFPACSDDDISCGQSDFIGNWGGDLVCDSSSTSYLDFDVLDDDGGITTLFIGTELTSEIDGCTLTASGDFGTAIVEIEGTYNGTTMDVNIKFNSATQTDCSGSFTKN